ncbi:MAG: serine--tRNA ligase [Patescibacteria group bacterium]
MRPFLHRIPLAFQEGVWYTTVMIDRELLRQNPHQFRDSLTKRGEDPARIDEYLKLDTKWRELTVEIDPLRAEKNQLSRGGKPTPAVLKKAQALAKRISAIESELKKAETAVKTALWSLPNLVAADVPVGKEESANTTIGQFGHIRLRAGLSHHELMTKLGWLDLKTAAEFSGSRFRYLKGDAAWAHLQIMGEALRLAVHHGFTPIIPPVMTRAETLEKTGYLPFLKDDFFKVEKDDLLLSGTSEQTLLALFAGQTFKEEELPIRLVGFSTCFRREVGSYGKDVEGMFRQHQFDKVEMVSITTPEKSVEEHEFLVSMEEEFVKKLKLPYQKVLIGSGDLGPTAAKKIDIEAWFPSQARYRETHSASNCTDFQTRRLGVKYRTSDGQDKLAHSLNGTLATERLLISYIENNQHPDGSVSLPRHWRI